MSAAVPFAWQDKRTLRRIRELCEDYSTALAVYLALTVAASDKQTEEFQVTHEWLAQLSGFSARTVRARVGDLQKIGVVSVSTPALRSASTYRLLPFGNGCPTLGNGCRAIGNGTAPPLPPLEERKNQTGKNGHPRPLGTADRIGLENQRKAMIERRDELRGELSDFVARQESPTKVNELRETEQRIGELDRRLGNG